ncbi:MAG: Flagellar protein fliS [Planctomycetota bacterium]|jgi:flagellar protein FliS
MSYAHAAAAYQRNAVLTASPEKIVKMLYDGAIKNLERCRESLANSATARTPETSASLGKAIGIVGELRASLDMAVGGKLAEDLDRLYEFSIDQITQSNSTRTAIGVTNALKVIRTLKEGWDVAIPG